MTHVFVCLWSFIVPLENFSLIWRRHHCWWRATNFDLCSTLMAMEQWGFFNVPHLLAYPLWWSSPRTRDTHTCCRAFDSGAVTTCFYDSGLSRPGIGTRSPACEANATVAVNVISNIWGNIKTSVVCARDKDDAFFFIIMYCRVNRTDSQHLFFRSA